MSSVSSTGAHKIAQFLKKLLDEDISVFSGSEMLPIVKGAFISTCCQIYGTCEGLQVLIPYGLHESIANAWKKVSIFKFFLPPCKSLFQIQLLLWCHIAVKVVFYEENVTSLAS